MSFGLMSCRSSRPRTTAINKREPVARRVWRRSIFAALLTTGTWVAPGVHGADIWVSSMADAGAGSLRDAIEQANLNPTGADTIRFDSSLMGHTITVQSMLPMISKGSGGSLNIVGLGSDQLVISGQNQSRVFWVESGNVSIEGMKIAEGLAKGGNGAATELGGGGGGGLGAGGALFVNTSGNVTMRNVRLANNEAQGGNGGGYNSSFSRGGGGGGGLGGDGGAAGYNGGGGGGGFSVPGDRVISVEVEVEVPPSPVRVLLVLSVEPAAGWREEMGAAIFQLEVLVKRLEEVVGAVGTLMGEMGENSAAAVGEEDMRMGGMADSAAVAVGLGSTARWLAKGAMAVEMVDRNSPVAMAAMVWGARYLCAKGGQSPLRMSSSPTVRSQPDPEAWVTFGAAVTEWLPRQMFMPWKARP